MKNWTLIFLLMNILNCNSSEIDGVKYQDAALIVQYFENRLTHGLDAFKSTENDKILKENASSNYSKLKWFVIGHPVLVQSKASNNNENLFQFNSRGFSVNVQMLTNQHRKFFVQEIKRKYKIDIDSDIDQKDNLNLSNFTCKFTLLKSNDLKEVSELSGYISSFTTFPLRFNFKLPKGSKKLEWFNQSLSKNESNYSYGL
jgi:hypothetical protein